MQNCPPKPGLHVKNHLVENRHVQNRLAQNRFVQNRRRLGRGRTCI
jgi:hypothetical protein